MGWHFKLGHVNNQYIQSLMRPRNERDPFISTTSPKASSCPIPDCFACRTAKAHRLPDNSTVEEKVSSKDGILKAENLKPGSVILVLSVCQQS